ncbi:MAG: hypothetical protein IKK10_01300 [Clostridia bacterium]|nr:hypothetical protein [Clostridia bacterium]
MKRNIYTNTIKKIKAPQGLVDNSIDNLYSADNDNKVIVMKKNKHFKLKLTSAVAASLVIIISLSFIIHGKKPQPSHPFIISVQAVDTSHDSATMDEITHESYIKIDQIKNFGQGACTQTHGYYNENDEYILIDENEDLLFIEKEFTLELNCIGENIENITYTAHNTYLTYMPYYKGLADVVELTDAEREKYHAYSSSQGFGWASSCTFDYDCQPKSSLDHELDDDSLDGTLPLRIAFHIELEDGKYVIPSIDDCDLVGIFEEEFNARSDEYALDVTANFKDGTSTTKTLKFKCERKENHLYLCAIEDFS